MWNGLMITTYSFGQKPTTEIHGFRNFGSIGSSAGWKGSLKRTLNTTRLAQVSEFITSAV